VNLAELEEIAACSHLGEALFSAAVCFVEVRKIVQLSRLRKYLVFQKLTLSLDESKKPFFKKFSN